jgi:hypothetical protein
LCEESGVGLQQLDCRQRGRFGPDGLGVSIKGSVAKCFTESCTNPVAGAFPDGDPDGVFNEDAHSSEDADCDENRNSDQDGNAD